ncbi:MAG: bifunctional riboflavin kinase/FAD synthetase [Elusimicrobia bacterium]|nr:bifunctional riboflavin kinase/FAD synthetase [Elusimicrobiota bacterium]
MRVYYGLQHLKKLKQPVIALGTFDGVHLGHQQLIKAAVTEARESGGTSIVLTFDHIPREVLNKNITGVLLTATREKIDLIRQLDAQVMVVLKFNQTLARMEPQDFIKNILVKKLGIKSLWVGEHYHFGAGQAGGVETLKNFSQQFGYAVKVIPNLHRRGQKVSSSKIRELLRAGSLKAAVELLGRPHVLIGKVITGRGLGRKLAFPTANLNIDKRLLLPLGIYAAWAKTGNSRRPAVVFIGYRASLGMVPKLPKIEAHLLGFKGRLYGKTLRLELLRKLRQERFFRNHTLLAQQIARDVAAAARVLKHE